MAAHAQDGAWACTRQPRSRGGSEVHPWQAACPAVLPLTQPVAAPPPGRGWNAGREEAWKRTRTGPELVLMGLVCGLHPCVIRAVEGLGHSSPGEERIVPPVTFKCALAIDSSARTRAGVTSWKSTGRGRWPEGREQDARFGVSLCTPLTPVPQRLGTGLIVATVAFSDRGAPCVARCLALSSHPSTVVWAPACRACGVERGQVLAPGMCR